MKLLTTLVSILICCVLMAASCKNRQNGNTNSAQETARKLYEQYENGEIEQCQFEGKTVFKCSLNAYDAGNEIYDEAGEKIGSCYYNTDKVDAICENLSDCKTVWRKENNIWGKPGVNELGIETNDQPEDNPVMALYETYQAGEIEECSLDGNTYYKCAHNAYDTGNEIYDATGKHIGSCYYSSGKVDEICKQLAGCKAIWRNAKNIWGKPAANEIGIETND